MQTTSACLDLKLALRLAQSALGAYETIPQIKARGAIPIYRPRFDLQAVIENWDDCTILAFRGTSSLENWKVDASAIPSPQGVHTGFEEAYDDLKSDIFDNLPHTPFRPGFLMTLDQSKPLYITGHSLGGALATECAVTHILPDAVYTFNQPRVFTKKYIARESCRIDWLNMWRIVDQEDIVSHLPGLIAGYRHIGNLALIDDQNALQINPSSLRQTLGHIKGISADVFRIFSGHLPNWVIIKDHSMSLCLQRLRQMVDNPETAATILRHNGYTHLH